MSEPVRSATVHVGDIAVATLERTKDGCQLQYLPSAVSAGKPAVCFTMPVRAEPYKIVGDNLPPFFAGLLPEGVRLDALIRRLKASRSDMYTLLIHIGDETVGDVTVLPTGTPKSVNKPLRIGSRITFAELRAKLIDPGGDLTDAGIAGVMAKVSSSRITAPIAGMGRKKRYLLKFEDPAYPDLATNEHAVMQLAVRCGFSAAKTKVLFDPAGEAALLVERFDRVWQPNGSYRRVHVEDACQFLDLYPADKYNVSLGEVATGLKGISSSGLPSILELVERFCFTYLVGDSDYHAKNVSAWINPETGVHELSPLYDVVCSLPYKGLNQRSALAMDGRDTEFRVKDFKRFGERFELPASAVEESIKSLAERVLLEVGHLNSSQTWPYDSSRVFNIVSERIRKLLS